jgi:hypothetical protein
VRLDVEFDDDSRQHWPLFEVPLLVATAAPGMFGFNQNAEFAPVGDINMPVEPPPPDGTP